MLPCCGLRADLLRSCCGLPAPVGQQYRNRRATRGQQDRNEGATRPQQKGTSKAARPQQDRNRGATTCKKSVVNLWITRPIIFHGGHQGGNNTAHMRPLNATESQTRPIEANESIMQHADARLNISTPNAATCVLPCYNPEFLGVYLISERHSCEAGESFDP